MSTDGCDHLLISAEVRQFVPAKTIALLDKIQQDKELELAGLGGLEKCPFCVEYAVIIDNPDERLFKCLKADCLVISCRLCKKEGHLGMSCAEAEKENNLPSLHAVEGELISLRSTKFDWQLIASLTFRCDDGCVDPQVSKVQDSLRQS